MGEWGEIGGMFQGKTVKCDVRRGVFVVRLLFVVVEFCKALFVNFNFGCGQTHFILVE